jgi:hypothetical protein
MVPAAPKFTPAPEQPQARPQVGPPVVLAPAQKPAPQPPPSETAAAQPQLRPAQAAPPPAVLPAAPVKTSAPMAVTPPAKPAPAPKPAPEKTAAEKAAEKAALARAKQILSDKPVAPPVVKAVKAGVAAVQIGAVASPALADKTWNDAVALAPGLAAGKGKGVEKVEKDGKTLYRTSVTGFASREAASAFCGKLKAAGKACFVK